MTNETQALIDEYRNFTVERYEKWYKDYRVLLSGYTGFLSGLMAVKLIDQQELQDCILEISRIFQKIT